MKEYCLKRIGGEEGLKKLEKMYKEEREIREIMKELGLSSPNCIYILIGERRRRSYRGYKRITKELEEKVLELRRMGYSIPAIAKKLGISVGSVHGIIKKHRLASSKQ